ncbi:PPOX class F420-dependent oxidoreductase [Streptomyces noursei]|uniref:PPOX class F420-dependent oxidoreductase n=1 Tax=Streptomyces yunnanensis TaxID=156453 RepID=A0ABY8ABQ6_9ACTN|nr:MULTISPECIES: PPOX class F420-dependent oxidoreductase [Streptomyces]ANZ16854.1 pyridoxamine 5'-phosphate oxidase-related protein [Streptomyces noursei ATCC 11455]AJC56575.1 putative pyridoxamine 5'-phosphate oxidase-related protein [Streptomyces sp. 769]MCZ0993863.1 PPOX class F420-dependent oxidoreductase [Streptomyces noursei]MCZ1017492.1 PPOX class F420-dependent oxidoreductase [Streptomyces noursei]WEB40947.1 PPOX class F420-dependent oxidoreductase [Streptomyces yunnanensis]
MRTSPSPGLAPFEDQGTILLTTYKKDGTGVDTPVNFAVDGDHAYFRTFGSAWKVRRMRNFPEVEFCASTWRGRPTGPTVRARARLLDPATREYRRAERSLTRKYPLIHGLVVPLVHRLRREPTLHYELRLIDEEPPSA